MLSAITSFKALVREMCSRGKQRSVLLFAYSLLFLMAVLAVYVASAMSARSSSNVVQLSPGASLQTAFAAAQPGDVIELGDGSYGCVSLSGQKTGDVTIRAAAGAHPFTTCQMSLDVSHLVLDGLQVAGIRSSSASFVTLKNVDVTCKDSAPYQLWNGHCSAGVFLFNTVHDFKMVGGSVGPTWDDIDHGAPGQSQVGITLNNCTGCVVRNVTFDGVAFHDNRRIDNLQHTSCMMVGGTDGFTLRNSTFTNCAVFDVFMTWWNFVSPQYPPGKNIVVEGNRFGRIVPGCPSGCQTGFYSIQFADYPPAWNNVTLAGNQFDVAAQISHPGTAFYVAGNSGTKVAGCPGGITYTGNQWSDGKCGPSDGAPPPPATTTTATTVATTTTTTTTPASPPDKPTGLTITSFTARTVTISWLPAPRATTYQLYKDGVAVSTGTKLTAKFSLSFGAHKLGVAALSPIGSSTVTVLPVKSIWTAAS